MALMKPVVLTASIDNEDAIKQWVDSVGAAAHAVQEAIDDLSRQLADAPHIAITLHQHYPEDSSPVRGEAAAEGAPKVTP